MSLEMKGNDSKRMQGEAMFGSKVQDLFHNIQFTRLTVFF